MVKLQKLGPKQRPDATTASAEGRTFQRLKTVRTTVDPEPGSAEACPPVATRHSKRTSAVAWNA